MFKLKRELSKLLEEVLCQSITLSMLFCISKIALTVENGTCREFFSNYFVFSEIAFTVENGPYREFFFHFDCEKYRTFFQTQQNIVFKAVTFRQKTP